VEPKALSEHLTGERIYLKRHELSLASIMFDYVNEDRDRLNRFLPWVEYIKSVADEEAYIKMINKKWDECTHFDYGMFLLDGTYMGNIGVHSIIWRYNSSELGYWILGKFEGHGYVAEAVSILEKHLFEVGFHRVQIRCSDLNERSEKVPLRCGYEFEGTAREDAIEKGAYRNTKTFSKLATD
jgi:ribosomal-protein-serine acetyltransferase